MPIRSRDGESNLSPASAAEAEAQSALGRHTLLAARGATIAPPFSAFN